MNEIKYYRLILNKMEEHKKKNPSSYINDEHEYMMKEEIYITNDAYVSNGDGNIITDLLSKKIKDYSRAVNFYGNTIEYIKNSNIIDI